MNRERRLARLTEHFTPAATLEQLADAAIAALEADPTVLEVDGVPIWEIQQMLDTEIARQNAAKGLGRSEPSHRLAPPGVADVV